MNPSVRKDSLFCAKKALPPGSSAEGHLSCSYSYHWIVGASTSKAVTRNAEPSFSTVSRNTSAQVHTVVSSSLGRPTVLNWSYIPRLCQPNNSAAKWR
jgi:hypothetical protein